MNDKTACRYNPQSASLTAPCIGGTRGCAAPFQIIREADTSIVSSKICGCPHKGRRRDHESHAFCLFYCLTNIRQGGCFVLRLCSPIPEKNRLLTSRISPPGSSPGALLQGSLKSPTLCSRPGIRCRHFPDWRRGRIRTGRCSRRRARGLHAPAPLPAEWLFAYFAAGYSLHSRR